MSISSKLRGFKVADSKRSRICGVACATLSDLRLKGCRKLNISNSEASKVAILLQDGTFVEDDDYFQTLPAQTLFIFQKKGETALTALDTRLQTKEDYMSSRARDRVRGYLYKTQDELRKRTDCRKQQKIIENVLAKLKAQLTKDGHFGSYFDRKTKVISNRFCNPSGYFQCEGRWDVGKCLYHENLHGINPYESHEMMVIFSTWNLDHGIERSRTIIPSLLEATKIALDCDKEDKLNWEYFYSLLFTRSNLRLVHIVCHDKGSHTSRTCDPGEYFMECKNR
ncbi:DNA fragmentation factor subunit beta isoform X2 [Ischnura elegans]|uniref:DNA fragmentation factor subunit beta isoform X2 n=1 Tax=Ischnura elegans TaxID=197161 RepID=UPI001ED8A506|nr:DNA fragmentation factor subunit beta isoform X2 [Ischnura elegans]